MVCVKWERLFCKFYIHNCRGKCLRLSCFALAVLCLCPLISLLPASSLLTKSAFCFYRVRYTKLSAACTSTPYLLYIIYYATRVAAFDRLRCSKLFSTCKKHGKSCSFNTLIHSSASLKVQVNCTVTPCTHHCSSLAIHASAFYYMCTDSEVFLLFFDVLLLSLSLFCTVRLFDEADYTNSWLVSLLIVVLRRWRTAHRSRLSSRGHSVKPPVPLLFIMVMWCNFTILTFWVKLLTSSVHSAAIELALQLDKRSL